MRPCSARLISRPLDRLRADLLLGPPAEHHKCRTYALTSRSLSVVLSLSRSFLWRLHLQTTRYPLRSSTLHDNTYIHRQRDKPFDDVMLGGCVYGRFVDDGHFQFDLCCMLAFRQVDRQTTDSYFHFFAVVAQKDFWAADVNDSNNCSG